MKKDLKINYSELVALNNKIQEVKDSFTEFSGASKVFKEAVEAQKGESFVSLLDFYERNVDSHQKELFTRLETIETVIGKFIDEMNYYISPVEESKTVRVHTDNIAWQIYKMKSAIGTVSNICYDPIPQTGDDYWQYYSYKDYLTDEENEANAQAVYQDNLRERSRRERNYQKIQSYQANAVRELEQALYGGCTLLNNLYENYVVPYEDADDRHGKRMHDYYTDWTTFGERFDIYNIRNADRNEVWMKYLKKAGKAGLDVVGEAGRYGSELALPIALLKNVIDADGVSGKDVVSTLKGMGYSIIGIGRTYKDEVDFGWPLTTKHIKELTGLAPYKTIVLDSAKSGWAARLENAINSAGATLRKEIMPWVEGVNAKGGPIVNKLEKGTKIAGWALALLANGYSNYEEYTEGEISGGRAWAETFSETLIDIGKNAAICAGVAAGAAALGVSAPAIVVGGIAVGISLAADVACEKLTGNTVTEVTSDFILNAVEDVGLELTKAKDKAGAAIAGWIDKVTTNNQIGVSGAGAW